MGAKKKTNNSSGELTFEQAMQALAKIVEQLEAGDLPLAESISLFEEGMRLAKTSQAHLDKAEQRVEELLSVDDDGTPQTVEFEEH